MWRRFDFCQNQEVSFGTDITVPRLSHWKQQRGLPMNGIIYLVGLVVVIIAVLSFFGLR